MKRQQSKTGLCPAAIVCSTCAAAILLLLVLVYLPLTVPRLMGYRIYNIVSGSMEPQIPTGSIVYVKDAAAEEIAEGDVIAFRDGDALPVVHRVVENHLVEGEFVTKGDANAENDMRAIPYDLLDGKVVFHIAVLGRVADWAVSGMGKIYAAGFILAAMMLQILAGRFREMWLERQSDKE